jgi:hypothetical protein
MPQTALAFCERALLAAVEVFRAVREEMRRATRAADETAALERFMTAEVARLRGSRASSTPIPGP